MGHPRPPPPDNPVLDERARRLGDLIAAPVLTLADVALLLDIPMSTMFKLMAEGKGPRTFKLGRKVFVAKPQLTDWIDHMVKVSADH